MSNPVLKESLDTQRALVCVVDRSTRELRIVSGDHSCPRAAVLVRDGNLTVGYYQLDGTDDLVDRAIAAAAEERPRRMWEPGIGAGIDASIVICTLGRNPLLPESVRAALRQKHATYEVIVVDNDPASGGTRHLLADIDDPRLTIVSEHRAGLSHARNRGIAAARGSVVAFTDDDALIDERWLPSLLDVFAADETNVVGAVTGPVFPAELQYPSQRYFEARGGFPKTLKPTVWSRRIPPLEVTCLGVRGVGGPLFPFATARVGAGVSMAFSREALDSLGSFDTALGAGTLTGGGEDLDAFARILRAGFAIVTTPDAVVFHVHRRDLEGLETQTHGDGTGMAAVLSKSVLTDPFAGPLLTARIPRILRRVSPNSERIRGADSDVPGDLSKREVSGFLHGPALYGRSLLRAWKGSDGDEN